MAYALMFPFAVAAVLLLAYMPEKHKWWCAFPAAIAFGMYLVRAAINEWWYTRFPRCLDAQERGILERHFAYYRSLSPDGKERFERRLKVFLTQKDIQMRGADEPPGDVTLLIGATAVQLTFGLDDETFVMRRLGVVVLFARTFITPNISHQLHAGELHTDDYNTVLLAINASVDGIVRPRQYYNIALHTFALALQYELGVNDQDLPDAATAQLSEQLRLLRNFKPHYLSTYTGRPDADLFAVCVEHFFQIPDLLHQHLPQVYQAVSRILHQDPLQPQQPVLLTIPTSPDPLV